MPIYVLHGFQWPRKPIREFIIVNNVDDGASDYIMGPTTPDAFRATLTKLWPAIMARLPYIQFIEQHDPDYSATQPYAFVADVVVEANGSIDIDKTREVHGPSATAWEAFYELRDKLYEFAKQFNPGMEEFQIRWYVHCILPFEAPVGVAKPNLGAFAYYQLVIYRYAVYNGDPERLQDQYQRPVDAEEVVNEDEDDNVCTSTIQAGHSTR